MNLDDFVDRARLERHDQFLAIWTGLPAEELLADLNVLTQLVAFRARQERVLLEARVSHLQGATHDCGEWKHPGSGLCQVCGRAL